ncbi:MAG: hypothetical protein O2963_00180 [Proteobacteria bacterium]|nr:hypothetical protein [Pseudomonadota bacterium]
MLDEENGALEYENMEDATDDDQEEEDGNDDDDAGGNGDDQEPPQKRGGRAKKRINQLTYKVKEKDRENEDLIRMNASLIEKIDKLSGNFTKFQTETEEEKRAKKLEEIETRMDDAFADNDIDLYQKSKRELKEAQDRFSEIERKRENPSNSEANAKPAGYDPDLDVFKKYNPWFNSNKDMTDKAVEIDAELAQHNNWKTAARHDYLAEVSRRTLSYFNIVQNPYNQGGGITSGVMGDGGSPDTSSSSDAGSKLTREQRQTAERMFPHKSAKEAYKTYASHI